MVTMKKKGSAYRSSALHLHYNQWITQWFLETTQTVTWGLEFAATFSSFLFFSSTPATSEGSEAVLDFPSDLGLHFDFSVASTFFN